MSEQKQKQLFQKLPQILKNFVPNPNFSKLNLSDLSDHPPETIISSIKTQTILSSLSPLVITQPSQSPFLQTKPTILVFCQPSQQIPIQNDKIFPYTPTAYVNWLQSAGAKCVPISYNIDEGSIQFLLQRSHGMLIPGGGSNLYRNFDGKEGQGPVMLGFMKIWRYVLKMWVKGVKYAIWGTCLGLEIVLLAISGDTKVLSSLNSRGHQVQIYSHYENSSMLNKLPLQLRIKAENYKLLNFQHSWGISVKKFLSTPKLVDKMKIVQISKDKNGKYFCSAIQGKSFPVFLSQYHPEKQAYQWTRAGQIRHCQDSILLSQKLAQRFVQKCRQCRPSKQFGSPTQQVFYGFHQYKQIYTGQKMYKVYAIDYKYRENDKQLRKQIKSKRSISTAPKSLKSIS